MLDDAVAAFLDHVTERRLDEPLLALLRARGYHELHLTHGLSEFGKDVIGQLDGEQWVFQSKAGDIGQTDWRQMTGQLDELRLSELSHPGFRADLPRRPVLTLTGRLKGNALLAAQEYDARARARGEPELEIWGRDRLIGELAGNSDAVLRGAVDGQLLSLVGAIAASDVDLERIEVYSRRWTTWEPARIAGLGVIEAALLCERLADASRLDLACHTALCLVRGAVAGSSADLSAGRAAIEAAGALFETYAKLLWNDVDDRLLDPVALVGASGPSTWVTYQLRCTRIAELISLLALRRRGRDAEAHAEITGWLARFAAAQPGVSRPLGDRYAVGLIPLALALRDQQDSVAAVLQAGTVWLCDRNERGQLGVADVDASRDEEIARVLGSSLGLPLQPRRASLIGTVLLDLAALVGLRDLYGDIYNDLLAVDLHCPVLLAPTNASRYTNPTPGARWDLSVDYAEQLGDDPPAHHLVPADPPDELVAHGRWWELLAVSAVVRDRWFISAIRAALADPPGLAGPTSHES